MILPRANYSGPTLVPTPSGDESIHPYGYVPSLGMGVVGLITFAIVAAPHLWYLFTRRGVRSVHGLFFFAGIVEMLAYGARLYSNTHEWSAMAFLIGVVLVQIATILVTAPLYKAIQRGIKYTPGGRVLSPMRPRSLLTLFVILDVVWVLVQCAGEYYIATSQTDYLTDTTPTFSLSTADMMFLAGNVLQAVTIIIVAVFVWVIMRRFQRLVAQVDPNEQYPVFLPLFYQILLSLGLFLVRLVMRIARGAQGPYAAAWDHEAYFAIFEYLPILAICALWAARPLWKFLFPFGHEHGEGAHTSDAAPSVLPPSPQSAAAEIKK
ncbi:hypothetical protein Q5752_004608 [Cryptotrichosporon argae]